MRLALLALAMPHLALCESEKHIVELRLPLPACKVMVFDGDHVQTGYSQLSGIVRFELAEERNVVVWPVVQVFDVPAPGPVIVDVAGLVWVEGEVWGEGDSVSAWRHDTLGGTVATGDVRGHFAFLTLPGPLRLRSEGLELDTVAPSTGNDLRLQEP